MIQKWHFVVGRYTNTGERDIVSTQVHVRQTDTDSIRTRRASELSISPGGNSAKCREWTD